VGNVGSVPRCEFNLSITTGVNIAPRSAQAFNCASARLTSIPIHAVFFVLHERLACRAQCMNNTRFVINPPWWSPADMRELHNSPACLRRVPKERGKPQQLERSRSAAAPQRQLVASDQAK